jgi:hypothetical protein
MPLACIIEHFLDPLGQGRQHRFPEQGVQTGQQQGAQNDGDQDFDGRIKLAFPAVAGEDTAGSYGGRGSLVLQLAKQMFHGFSSLYSICVPIVGHGIRDIAFFVHTVMVGIIRIVFHTAFTSFPYADRGCNALFHRHPVPESRTP